MSVDLHNNGTAPWAGQWALTTTSLPAAQGCGAVQWHNVTVAAGMTQNAITAEVADATRDPGHCVLVGQAGQTLWDSGRDPCLAKSFHAVVEVGPGGAVGRIACPDEATASSRPPTIS